MSKKGPMEYSNTLLNISIFLTKTNMTKIVRVTVCLDLESEAHTNSSKAKRLTLDRAAPSVRDRPKDLRPLLTISKSRPGVSPNCF